MSEPERYAESQSLGAAGGAAPDSSGIVRELGELPPGAVVTEAALARMLHRHPVSIKRAVKRGELPRPTRLLGGPVWTVGSILAHVQGRLEAAQKEAEREARRFSELRP